MSYIRCCEMQIHVAHGYFKGFIVKARLYWVELWEIAQFFNCSTQVVEFSTQIGIRRDVNFNV